LKNIWRGVHAGFCSASVDNTPRNLTPKFLKQAKALTIGAGMTLKPA
jgi:hypothetical protein